jgi:predicted transposase YbfD/YdcC
MSLFTVLCTLKDPRKQGFNTLHPLTSILLLCVCAVLCGAEDYEEIHDYGKNKLTFLSTFIDFPHGIPSKDTIERVLEAIDSTAFNACFMRWVRECLCLRFEQIGIDGKTVCGSRRHDGSPLHVISAAATELGISLGQVHTTGKGNEIKAIKDLLPLLNLTDKTVTIDAIGCQVEIIAQIADLGGRYAIALEANQGNLHEDVGVLMSRDVRCPATDAFSKIDKQGSKIVNYEVTVAQKVHWIVDVEKWAKLEGFIKVVCRTEHLITQKITNETRLYLHSIPNLTAAGAYDITRGHWGIENKIHWVLDVVLNEDAHCVHHPQAAQNLSILRKIVVNVLQMDKTPKKSKKKKIKNAAWNDDFLKNLLQHIVNSE